MSCGNKRSFALADPQSTPTTHYGWAKPAVGASQDVWGGDLNGNLDSQDTTLWSIQAAQSNYLPLAGGELTGAIGGTTASFSGGIWTGNSFNISVSNVAATNPVYGRINNTPRWAVFLGNGSAETGGNAGSDFQINAYTDSGGAGPVGCIAVTRKTGQVSMSSGLNVTGGGLLVTGNSTFANTLQADGYVCKPGQSSTPPGYLFNFNWTTTTLDAWIGTTRIGSVTITSDYRVKKDVAPLDSTWDRVKALKPISYTHKDYTPEIELERDADALPLIVGDDIEHWGFIAHELQDTLIPSAASGVKDQADVIQSPNPWTVIATLTKALQEAMERIEALEANR